LKSPVRENRTPGSVQGSSGNRRSYCDGVFTPWIASKLIFALNAGEKVLRVLSVISIHLIVRRRLT